MFSGFFEAFDSLKRHHNFTSEKSQSFIHGTGIQDSLAVSDNQVDLFVRKTVSLSIAPVVINIQWFHVFFQLNCQGFQLNCQGLLDGWYSLNQAASSQLIFGQFT